MDELNDYKQRMSGNTADNEQLRAKIQKLMRQNSELNDEFSEAQESIRMAVNQNQKLTMEIKQFRSRAEFSTEESHTYKTKIEKLLSENTVLDNEMRDAQEGLRLSANQLNKLNNQLKITCN